MSEEIVEAQAEADTHNVSSRGETVEEVPRKGRERNMIRIIFTVCVALVVVVSGALFAAFATGALAPAGAAAKYNLFDYIPESETTAYIETYKEQMGYGDASDEQWAAFLAAYNLTPERLRASTIDQLLTDALVRAKCKEFGISVSDEELDAAVDQYKNNYASGSDKIWEQTLSQVGQDEQGFREGIELSLLKQKLAEHEVETPQPTDEQVKTTIATFIDNSVSNDKDLLLKHTYCFKKSKSSAEGSLAESEEVEKIRKALLETGATEESFASIVELYSDDEELKENAGANGWDADTTGYSEEYVKALQSVDAKGAVSSVFSDDEDYFFIWVSDTYELPKDSAKAQDIELSGMPDALHRYFTDLAAAALWEADAQTYLTTMTQNVAVVIYPMPSDVPYNVDMSLADTGAAEGGE